MENIDQLIGKALKHDTAELRVNPAIFTRLLNYFRLQNHGLLICKNGLGLRRFHQSWKTFALRSAIITTLFLGVFFFKGYHVHDHYIYTADSTLIEMNRPDSNINNALLINDSVVITEY